MTLSSTSVLSPHDLRPLVHLGIDLGGTSLRIGAFDANMQLLARHVMPTRVSAGPRAVIGDMSDAVFSLLDETGGHTESIGLGSPGPLDLPAGTLGQLPNFRGWDFFPLRSTLEEFTGLLVGSYIGRGLAALVNTLDLPLYVIGGGVAAAWDLFAAEMFRTLHELSYVYRLQKASQLAHREPGRPFITPAILGADAGLLGGGHAFLAH